MDLRFRACVDCHKRQVAYFKIKPNKQSRANEGRGI